MSDSSPAPTDDFGADLEAQDKALRARQDDLDADREEWTLLAKAYVKLLKSRGRPLPAFAESLDEPPPTSTAVPASRSRAIENGLDRYGRPYDGVTRVYRIGAPRIGEKRREVLLYIAKATLDGRDVTAREIVNATEQAYHLVVNTFWLDAKRGVLEYTDGHKNAVPGKVKKVKMTPLGFEILEKAGLLDGPAKEIRP
jgi:hypothetical protein